MASPTIQFKRGAFVNLPDLKAGEPGFTTDKYDFYIGTEDAGASTNQFYGSGRYWEREDATTAARLKLVDKDGLNSISLQSANTLSGISTLIFPNGGGTDGEVLQIASGGGTGSYTLEWATLAPAPGGISVSDEGTPVGSASSVTRLDFVGAGVTVSYSTDAVGIATITVSGDLNIDADSGGPSTVSAEQTLTVAGTANEIETLVSGQTITIGLPNDVTIGNDLTVTGDLFVNGNTTQVNTTSLTVEDTLIELGIVDGSAPSSDVNRDLGILFNWYDTELRKAAVFWDDSVTRVAIAQSVTETASVLTVATYAPVEIGSLWVNDAAGASQVIRHNGTERILENITVDGGSF